LQQVKPFMFALPNHFCAPGLSGTL